MAVDAAEQGTEESALVPALVDDRGAQGPDDASKPGGVARVLRIVELGATAVDPAGAAGADPHFGVIAEVDQFVAGLASTAAPALGRRCLGVVLRGVCCHGLPPGVVLGVRVPMPLSPDTDRAQSGSHAQSRSRPAKIRAPNCSISVPSTMLPGTSG
jgi:hypothetical protein